MSPSSGLIEMESGYLPPPPPPLPEDPGPPEDPEPRCEALPAEPETTYENLRCGSRNHLRSLARAHTSLTGLPYPHGGVLTTVILDPSMVTSIITSSMEQCGGN